VAGTNALGGGGGAGGESQAGANGGTGVVVIRLPSTVPVGTVSGGGLITYTTGYTVYRFTSSGTLYIP
jgi:hypothetical protein